MAPLISHHIQPGFAHPPPPGWPYAPAYVAAYAAALSKHPHLMLPTVLPAISFDGLNNESAIQTELTDYLKPYNPKSVLH